MLSSRRSTIALRRIASTPLSIPSSACAAAGIPGPRRTHLTTADRVKALQHGYAAPKADRVAKHLLATPRNDRDHPADSVGDRPVDNDKAGVQPEQVEDSEAWYNDPYLLSEKIVKLLARDDPAEINEAMDLVDRHRGAANAQVYGALIAGLAKRGHYKLVLKCNRDMVKRRIVPTPQTHTALLNAFAQAAASPAGDVASRTNRLADARRVWDEDLERPSTIHLNAMLKVCLACIAEGGEEVAWEIYRQSVPEDGSKRPSDVPAPDIYTITYMLRMCSDPSAVEGSLDNAMLVWKDALRLDRQERKNSCKSRSASDIKFGAGGGPAHRRFRIDAHAVSALLLCFIRASKREDVLGALPIVQEWLGLPLTAGVDATAAGITKSFRPARVDISTLLFGQLMHLASRLRDPDLALAWFSALTAPALAVQPDHDAYSVLVGLLISMGRPDDAWDILHPQPTSSLPAPREEHPDLSIRLICYVLGTEPSEPPSTGSRTVQKAVWLERATALVSSLDVTSRIDPKLDVRVPINLAELHVHLHDPTSAFKVLDAHRANILDTTRRKLDRYVNAGVPVITKDGRRPTGPVTTAQARRTVTRALARNPKQQADLAARLKALHSYMALAVERCGDGQPDSVRMEMLVRQCKEVIGVWDLLARKMGIVATRVKGEGRVSDEEDDDVDDFNDEVDIEEERDQGYKVVARAPRLDGRTNLGQQREEPRFGSFPPHGSALERRNAASNPRNGDRPARRGEREPSRRTNSVRRKDLSSRKTYAGDDGRRSATSVSQRTRQWDDGGRPERGDRSDRSSSFPRNGDRRDPRTRGGGQDPSSA
ncbi:hypothetical protein HKX48_009561 [Thoreauomyces humboldtii]|nr:hypothetical protein HKX48_009561 [Thoreauomyces humboldtii]